MGASAVVGPMAGNRTMGSRSLGMNMTTSAANDFRNWCVSATLRPLAVPYAGPIAPSDDWEEWKSRGSLLPAKMPRWIYSNDFVGRCFPKLVFVAAAGRQWNRREQ